PSPSPPSPSPVASGGAAPAMRGFGPVVRPSAAAAPPRTNVPFGRRRGSSGRSKLLGCSVRAGRAGAAPSRVVTSSPPGRGPSVPGRRSSVGAVRSRAAPSREVASAGRAGAGASPPSVGRAAAARSPTGAGAGADDGSSGAAVSARSVASEAPPDGAADPRDASGGTCGPSGRVGSPSPAARLVRTSPASAPPGAEPRSFPSTTSYPATSGATPPNHSA